MSSRSTRSSSSSPSKRTRCHRDTPPSPSSSSLSSLSLRRTPTKSNKSSTIEVDSKLLKINKLKIATGGKSARKGKENIAPGENEEVESDKEEEEDSMDVDLDVEVKKELCDEELNNEMAAATLPTPKSTPVKSQLNKLLLKTDATPSPRVINNIFSHAHALLSTTTTPSSSSSRPFIGRESQQIALLKFLSLRFPEVYTSRQIIGQEEDETISSPSLYVSGPPGLGKTALLNSILGEFETLVNEGDLNKSIKVHMENCSSLGSGGGHKGIWERLGRGLGIKFGSVQGQAGFEMGLKSGGKFLLILDEIDHILSPSASSRDLLNTLFALAHAPSSNLTLIGIANALDLTSRALHLPSFNLPTSSGSLKGKSKLVVRSGPQLLSFPPYDFKTIESIIKQRLNRLNSTYPFSPLELEGNESSVSSSAASALPLVHPMALVFCAKKVAAGTGDIRTALQVVRNAISTVENEERTRLKLPPTDVSLSNDNDNDNNEEDLIPSPPSTPTKNSSTNSKNQKKLDPLSILTPESTRKVSMSEMLLSLRLSGLTTPNPLASRLSSLPFNTRNILVGIAVSLSRELTPSSSTTFLSVASVNKGKSSSSTSMDASGNNKSSSISIRLNAAYEIYSTVLKKEGTLRKPLSKNEFTSALDILESSALIQLITFVSGKSTKSKSSSSSKKGAPISSDPIISLNPLISLPDLISALKEIPAKNCEVEEERGLSREVITNLSEGAMQETLRISRTILRTEEERVGRIFVGLNKGKKREREGVDEMAPREGFHGDGLAGGEEGKWLGEKKRKLE